MKRESKEGLKNSLAHRKCRGYSKWLMLIPLLSSNLKLINRQLSSHSISPSIWPKLLEAPYSSSLRQTAVPNKQPLPVAWIRSQKTTSRSPRASWPTNLARILQHWWIGNISSAVSSKPLSSIMTAWYLTTSLLGESHHRASIMVKIRSWPRFTRSRRSKYGILLEEGTRGTIQLDPPYLTNKDTSLH